MDSFGYSIYFKVNGVIMKHPMQYVIDHRFVENKIISNLVDIVGLNTIAGWDNDSEDYDQLLQLIGYSTGGVPFRDRSKYDIIEEKPEEVYENLYKKLKSDLQVIFEENDIE